MSFTPPPPAANVSFLNAAELDSTASVMANVHPLTSARSTTAAENAPFAPALAGTRKGVRLEWLAVDESP